MSTSAAELLRRLHEAATPGPWRAHLAGTRQGWRGAPEDVWDVEAVEAGPIVATCEDCALATYARSTEDAALIATLRTLLPELLALVEATGDVGDHRSDAWHVRRIRFALRALDARAAELTEEDDRG